MHTLAKNSFFNNHIIQITKIILRINEWFVFYSKLKKNLNSTDTLYSSYTCC